MTSHSTNQQITSKSNFVSLYFRFSRPFPAFSKQSQAWCEMFGINVSYTGQSFSPKNFKQVLRQGIPIKCFVFHRPTDPFFSKSKTTKIEESLVKEASTLTSKHTITFY